MRILIIANSESFHTARFANAFTDLGHKVVLLSATPYLGRVVKYDNVEHIEFLKFFSKLFIFLFPKKIKQFRPEISKAYHPFNFLILFRMLFLFFFINRLLKKEKFEAVFAMNLTTNGLFAARIKRNVKKVCTTLGCDLRLAKWYSIKGLNNNKFVFSYVDKRIDSIISYNDEEIKNFFNNNLFFKDKTKVFYLNGLGVNSELFNPVYKNSIDKKKYYGLKDDDILSVCFRQPRPIFNFASILIKLKNIIDKYNNFYFAIGTGGIESKELIDIVKKYNIEKNIIFMPNIPYEFLHFYVSQGDIFIDPIDTKKFPETLSIGPSGALLESMSCGLIPVIGNRPGMELYFKDELSDLVYENFEDDFENYLIKAIENINNIKLKDSIRQVILENSNWSKTVELSINLLS